MDNYVREWRQFRRLVQKQLSILAGIGVQHISDIENHRANASQKTLVKLAVALDCSVNELLTVNPKAVGGRTLTRMITPSSDADIARQLEQLATIFAGLAKLARHQPDRLPLALQKARQLSARSRNRSTSDNERS